MRLPNSNMPDFTPASENRYMARLTAVTVRLCRHDTSSLRIKKVIYSKLAKINEMDSRKMQLYRNPSDLLSNIIHNQCIKNVTFAVPLAS